MQARGVHWIPAALLVISALLGCRLPPRPSPETAELESSLLSADDVGGSFELRRSGQVGVSGGKVCPKSDFKFDDVGMVRADLVSRAADDEQIELVEQLHVVESGRIAVLMEDLKDAYGACYGLVWTDYGDTLTVESMTAPEVGDDRIAIHALRGNRTFTGGVDDTRRVYVAMGDIFAELGLTEGLLNRAETASITDEEFYRLVAVAIAKLPR